MSNRHRAQSVGQQDMLDPVAGVDPNKSGESQKIDLGAGRITDLLDQDTGGMAGSSDRSREPRIGRWVLEPAQLVSCLNEGPLFCLSI